MEKENSLNIHKKLNIIKKELSKREIGKSGHNKHLDIYYHELSDFLNQITELNEEYGINDHISIVDGLPTLTLTNVENTGETLVTRIPNVLADMQKSTDSIQKLGASLTYWRRYLYMTAYSIVEHDAVDVQPVDTSIITPAENAKKIKQYQDRLKARIPDEEQRKNVEMFLLTENNVFEWNELDFNTIDIEAFNKLIIDELNKLKNNEGDF